MPWSPLPWLLHPPRRPRRNLQLHFRRRRRHPRRLRARPLASVTAVAATACDAVNADGPRAGSAASGPGALLSAGARLRSVARAALERPMGLTRLWQHASPPAAATALLHVTEATDEITDAPLTPLVLGRRCLRATRQARGGSWVRSPDQPQLHPTQRAAKQSVPDHTYIQYMYLSSTPPGGVARSVQRRYFCALVALLRLFGKGNHRLLLRVMRVFRVHDPQRRGRWHPHHRRLCRHAGAPPRACPFGKAAIAEATVAISSHRDARLLGPVALLTGRAGTCILIKRKRQST